MDEPPAERANAGPPWRRRGQRQRPPWWPEDQSFPPEGERWRGIQRRMMRRIVVGLILLFLVVNVVAWSIFKAGSYWHGGGGSGSGGGPPWFVRIVGPLLLLGIIFYVGQRMRRAIAPVAEVMEAADRVAAGDYGARVEPAGKAEMRNLGVSFNRMAERLRENETQRRALFADIAHELRTPLAIIQGNVEAMLDGVYPRGDDQLAPVLEQTKVMARLLDDLRTLSVAQARELKLHRERVCPTELAEEVAAAFRRRAEARGIAVAVDASATEEIEADPLRIRQVLDNLVANAIRYAPDGGNVAIRAERVDGATRFSVSDNGPGIPPEQLPHVFDRFVKAVDSGGSGLGLAIAKGLVEAHDGRIWATSAPGEGATFLFDIPNQPVR